MKNLCVILARGGSKGIPKKNIVDLNGRHLISYTIDAAIKSEIFDEIVVSTDCDEIAKVAIDCGALIPFMRPEELSLDHVWSRDALKHAVLECERIFNKTYDYIFELPCVAPLRNSTHIKEACKKLVKTGADSVISVCKMQDKHPVRMKRIVDDKIYDFCEIHTEGEGSRRQDLDPCYIRNGAIYSMTRECIVENFSRKGDISRPYIMEDVDSVNIDSYIDLFTASAIMNMRKK